MKQEKRKRNYIYDAMKQILPQQLEGILVMVVASIAIDIELKGLSSPILTLDHKSVQDMVNNICS